MCACTSDSYLHAHKHMHTHTHKQTYIPFFFAGHPQPPSFWPDTLINSTSRCSPPTQRDDASSCDSHQLRRVCLCTCMCVGETCARDDSSNKQSSTHLYMRVYSTSCLSYSIYTLLLSHGTRIRFVSSLFSLIIVT